MPFEPEQEFKKVRFARLGWRGIHCPRHLNDCGLNVMPFHGYMPPLNNLAMAGLSSEA